MTAVKATGVSSVHTELLTLATLTGSEIVEVRHALGAGPSHDVGLAVALAAVLLARAGVGRANRVTRTS